MTWGIVLALAMLFVALVVRFALRADVLVLPPLEIADDDPLMKEAVARARATLPLLRELFVHRPSDTMAKIPLRSDNGATEHVWGHLIGLDDSNATVRIATPALTQKSRAPEVVVPVEEVEDWQVEQPDASIVGGFTIQAMYQIAKQRNLPLPKGVDRQVARFRSGP